jgi:hypothetical protein
VFEVLNVDAITKHCEHRSNVCLWVEEWFGGASGLKQLVAQNEAHESSLDLFLAVFRVSSGDTLATNRVRSLRHLDSHLHSLLSGQRTQKLDPKLIGLGSGIRACCHGVQCSAQWLLKLSAH